MKKIISCISAFVIILMVATSGVFAIEKNDIARAYSWANTGIRKYRQSKILAPLYIQALRLARKHTEASIYLSGLSDEMRNLPVVQLEK